MGRGFLPGDDRPNGPKVAVLSHALWQQRFGGRPPSIVLRVLHYFPITIDFKNLPGVHPSFVDRTRGYCQPQRIPRNDSAQIAARSQHPAPAVEVATKADKFGSDVRGFT